jgi:hypothetical protein
MRFVCALFFFVPGLSCSPTAPANPPELSVPIVDLSAVRGFIPFGAELSPGRLNPAYELRVSGANTEVRAATSGKVKAIEQNEQGDYEVRIQAPHPDYLIIYDHVQDLAVHVNDQVSAGTRLGRVGVWNNDPNVQGRVELQINKGGNLSICPRDIGTAEFNSAHDTALAAALPIQQQPGWTNVCLQATVIPGMAR